MKTIFQEREADLPDTLRLYLKDLAKFPQLKPEEEHELALKSKAGDQDAFRRLVESNLRFVVAMAKNIRAPATRCMN